MFGHFWASLGHKALGWPGTSTKEPTERCDLGNLEPEWRVMIPSACSHRDHESDSKGKRTRLPCVRGLCSQDVLVSIPAFWLWGMLHAMLLFWPWLLHGLSLTGKRAHMKIPIENQCQTYRRWSDGHSSKPQAALLLSRMETVIPMPTSGQAGAWPWTQILMRNAWGLLCHAAQPSYSKEAIVECINNTRREDLIPIADAPGSLAPEVTLGKAPNSMY